MNTAYLNGNYMALEEARISPMDRGFLFGDGVYEVIPSYDGKLVGFQPHIDRLQTNLAAISLESGVPAKTWHDIAITLMSDNPGQNLGIYLHVSRGPDSKRFHGFPQNPAPTIFAFAFDIAPQREADRTRVKGAKVKSAEDMRWKRCNIKSTSLLGNVLHFQHSHDSGAQETILFNERNELTEASSSNVFVVKNEIVSTPPLDNQILPGITRRLVLDILDKDGVVECQQRVISMDEVREADEIWLTSSSKEITPVTELDGKPVGNGQVGDLWQVAQTLFNTHKFSY